MGEVTTSGSRDGAVIEAWRRGESMTVPVTAQDIEAKTQAIGKLWGVDGHIPLQEAEKRDGNHIYIPFQFGVVGFRVSEQEGFHEIIRELTAALSLGYVRYLDFARMEEQNQALEQSLNVVARDKVAERIRAEVLSMRGSDDMLEVIVLMFKEMHNLGIDAPMCSVRFANEERQLIIGYTALVNPRRYGVSWTNPRLVELNENIATMTSEVPWDSSWNREIERWRKGDLWSDTRTVEEDLEETRDLWDYCGFDGPLPIIGPEWPIAGVPFAYGWVNVRYRKSGEDDLTIVQELTDALSLGYVRYLDFARVEEQNRTLEDNLVQLGHAKEEAEQASGAGPAGGSACQPGSRRRGQGAPGADQPVGQRSEIHAVRGRATDGRGVRGRPVCVHRVGHRSRYPQGQTGVDLRAVPARGRGHASGRYRSRVSYFPAPRADDGWADRA